MRSSTGMEMGGVLARALSLAQQQQAMAPPRSATGQFVTAKASGPAAEMAKYGAAQPATGMVSQGRNLSGGSVAAGMAPWVSGSGMAQQGSAQAKRSSVRDAAVARGRGPVTRGSSVHRMLGEILGVKGYFQPPSLGTDGVDSGGRHVA